MRRFSAALLATLLFLAIPVMARADGDKGAVPADKAKDSPAAKSADKSASAQPNTELQQLQELIQQQADELAAQRKALNEQQKEIDALKGGSAVQPSNAPAVAEPAPAAAPATLPATVPAATLPISEKPSSATPPLRATESSSASNASAGPASRPPQSNDQKLGPIALQDFKIGATFYGDFSHFTDTGFGPAFQDAPTTQLGPGNSGLNVFEINRAYINLFYTPNAHVSLRIDRKSTRLNSSHPSISYAV